jgi:SAM-dependent methyltransferase
LGYLTLWPLDYLSRLVNNKTDFPPLHLRRYVGPLRTFEASGAEFMTYLRLLVEMRPGENILDVGCGCGLMALYLKDYLAETGSYAGVDLHSPSINWCSKHIAGRRPNFRFRHIDVKSLAYNARGKLSADNFTFPYEPASFDVILFKSVFTHLRPAEVENYLQETSRMLKADGRCLATFFLLNQEQELLAAEGRNTLKFSFGDEHWRYVYEHSPESACAYSESFILSLLEKHDLTLARTAYYGSWSGRENGLSFQDMLIIKRA